jgi:4-aminobutyrate aminotransferase-like enzyme
MNSSQVLDLLRQYESRNITFIERDGSWPMVWERARGVHVWDTEGRKYLDLTAAFGVAATGHANPRVVRAGQKQMAKLLHAMGDVHPHPLKAKLARELSRLTFERWATGAFNAERSTSQVQRSRKAGGRSAGKTIFTNSGFEAVEAALKTALLATGRPGVIAFEGAYHGLGYGALNATHREHFRAAFHRQLGGFVHFVAFPASCSGRRKEALVSSSKKKGEPPHVGCYEQEIASFVRQLFHRHPIGAILVEPIQVRGGINAPPPGFLPLLRQLCDAHGALLILDEIYTGFGRTGAWFACEHSRVVPDLICLGKALTGGFPLSACVGRAEVMDSAWPESSGEAIHTSTFLGHPVGCAMALAQIEELKNKRLIERCAGEFKAAIPEMLRRATRDLPEGTCHCRGNWLLAGLEICAPSGTPATEPVLRIIKRMLNRGFILLPEGEHSNVISFTPPLTITRTQLWQAIRTLGEELHSVSQ